MVKIVAVQTVPPAKPTDPRQYLGVKLIPQNLSLSNILQRRFHVVLCYKYAWVEDSAWVISGWMKETLGRALSDHPLFAGRLRSEEESDDLHIVSNDSGVRLIEGSMTDMNLDDFVGLKMEKGISEVESDQLVFWDDLREEEPKFSPLFYVQVTNFSCGGYSIGISCSLLLADPFAITGFLKTWANHHNTIVSSNTNKIPTFYHPKFLTPNAYSPTLLMGSSNTHKAAAQTLVFQIPTSKILNILDENIYENLAVLCIDEAERAVGRKMTSKFCLLVVKPCEDVKVEICSREGVSDKSPNINISEKLFCSNIWEDDQLGLNKICFNEGNKTVHVSCWINSIVDEDSVMIIASGDLSSTSEMKIVVTFA